MLRTISDMKKLEISSDVDDIVFEESSDSDECEDEEIDDLFLNCDLLKEKVASENEYILHVASTSESDASIVTCLSDNSCILYKLSNSDIAHIQDLSEHNEKIIGCRFSSVNNNLLYTGSSDGTLKVWDVRTPSKSFATLTDTTATDGKSKTFNCFDVSSNDRLLTAGTDIFEGDAYILFWDIRNTNLLGGYWESHTDDITDVKFHPDNMNTLISGSTDSLINVYDLSQSSEDDALLDSLNTESSVEQLLWFKENAKNCISCITHVADLQLWQLDDVSPYQHVRRAELAKAIKRKNDGYIYIASHQAKTSLLVLVGSNYEDGQCIRGLEIKKGQVSPSIGFKENTQRVRCSWYSENTNILLTGGEKGLLNVWKVKKKI